MSHVTANLSPNRASSEQRGQHNEIISSIAAEELSLSHILNAEGEKLQYVLGLCQALKRLRLWMR